jgi:hypothetical protein
MVATNTMSAGSVQTTLAALRAVIDEREKLATADRELSKEKERLEASLLSFHNESGLDSLSGAGLSVSFDGEAMRAKYEPDRWAEIVKWAVSTGNDHIIQRRLTDAKVLDLIEQGVELPAGLTVENYTKLSVRRK